MAFSLPELPYSYDALEPVIDARTMEIHHSKHHAAYTNNLNAALEVNAAASNLSIEDILNSISTFSPAIRNNGGGFYNHNLFWTILSSASNADQNLPVLQAIEEELGGMESFKSSFSQAAVSRFGSGWAWLSVDEQGKLFVSSTPNQDNPLMDVVDQKGTPVLGLDVWEHAYYLNYQNRRPDYIQSFFTIINWVEVNRRYLAAKGA